METERDDSASSQLPVMSPTPILLPLATTLVVPPTLLVLIVLLSTSFHFVKKFKVPKDSWITAAHAFATEGIQILLSALAILSPMVYTVSLHNIGQEHDISVTQSALAACIGVPCIATLHVLAVYAVDSIEGLILLGTWQHPYEWKCFITTRTKLFSKKTRMKRGIHVGRKRASSAPGTVKEISKFEARMRKDQRRMEYLDLAWQFGARTDPEGLSAQPWTSCTSFDSISEQVCSSDEYSGNTKKGAIHDVWLACRDQTRQLGSYSYRPVTWRQYKKTVDAIRESMGCSLSGERHQDVVGPAMAMTRGASDWFSRTDCLLAIGIESILPISRLVVALGEYGMNYHDGSLRRCAFGNQYTTPRCLYWSRRQSRVPNLVTNLSTFLIPILHILQRDMRTVNFFLPLRLWRVEACFLLTSRD